MHLQRLTGNFVVYNRWANERLINWLRTIDSSLITRKVASSYPSIDFTLQHMLRAERFWLTFIREGDISLLNWSVREGEADVVMDELLSVSTQLTEYVNSLDEAALENKLQLDMPWAKNRLCRYEYIMHVVNHSTYHRGQIVTMSRGLGVTDGIPALDYNIFNIPRS
ncbi:MAG: DinB family protein [Flavobacteriales bacterium]|nr:DinB family protein [Flavobacteriales bacterium]